MVVFMNHREIGAVHRIKSNRDLAYRDAGGGRHWSVAQEGYKQMCKAFGVTAEG